MSRINRVERWVAERGAFLADELIEAIDRIRGGGPRAPMHPSPAGDDALLRKSSKKAKS
ncbi:MAG TPA: hypothetical protein VKF41_12605 [Bryobacteraceae bacterium]|nr:hypothetical protein [Bryobacteraceae bacterium]